MRAMSPVDHAWYRMDSPENLMMVHALMWTDEPLDWDVVRSDVAQGMLDRFPKFREHPVAAGVPLGRAGWEVDQDFDLDRHVVFHTLAGQGDRRALEEYVASQIPDPIDPAHPMWQVHCIDGFGSGSAVLFRMHHSIADGITLTRVLLSLTSTDDTHAGFVEAKSASGPVGLAVELSRSAASEGIRALRHPSRVVDATTAAVRGTRRLLHLATIPQKPRSALAGGVGCAKDVRWTDPWPLADVKAVSRAAGVTINDVLLSSLADALGRYLAEEGTPLESVRVMVPVNLRPLDQPLTADLGNVFGEYIVTLPTGEMAPHERLARMHDIVAELKGSPEAVVAYLTLVAIGVLPGPIEALSTRVFSGKVVATVSNVPGPRATVHLAGTAVAGIIGWVPGASDVGLGVSMFSYDGGVRVGLLTDATLIADPDRLCAHVTRSLADLQDCLLP